MKKLLSRIVCAVAVAAIAAYGVYNCRLWSVHQPKGNASVKLDIGQCGSVGAV